MANVIYDFQKELTEYCASDVKLLKQVCLSFKSVFEPLACFNPFSLLCLNTNHARIALEWLHWQQHQLPDEDDYIRHAGNSGEYRIPHSQYTVDGYHEKTNTVYEFQGCFWHGCPVCYSNCTESHHRLDNRCFDDVYRCTQVKLDLLRNRGFRVVEIWECQWEKLKREREDVCTFVDALNLSAPLNPRDAFFGGRTNALRLYHKVDETRGEKIRYFDFMSLYPWVNIPRSSLDPVIQTFLVILA